MKDENKQILTALNNAEFNYKDFGTVMLVNNKIISIGKTVNVITKDEEVEELVKEFVASEFGTTDVSRIMEDY